jgi:DNA-binding CsgD family transcriptional regulator
MMLPSPPDLRRIEVLARELGLTQAEARVAALLQLGLSNREAAQIAGLTEHTVNTYTKRVLGKLRVNSRAEMAHLLTWQAQGGLLS